MKKTDSSISQNYKIKKLSVGTSEGYILLDFDSILYLHSSNNYTTFYLTDNSKIIATKNLGYFEEKLINESFLRIHHAVIVNLNKVKGYTKAEGGQVIILNNESLPVSRNRKQKLLRFIKELC